MQSGTTLVELLVAITIIGFALVIVIGVFSTGLLDATLARRNTAVEAITRYELEKIHAGPFDSTAQPWSECFASQNANQPVQLGSYQGACPDATYSMRADVSCAAGCATPLQTWQIAVVAWPDGTAAGSPVSIVKINR